LTYTVNLSNVSFERQNRMILENINWTINPGEHWVLMGLNGSGKTSLLTLIMGYEWPSRGHVDVLGHRYGTVDLRDLRKRIGWVSHHLSEWMSRDYGHLSVVELVSGGLDAIIGKSRSTVTAKDTGSALASFELKELAHSRFSHLSQGEKTRVLLARAWMAEVDLLIGDAAKAHTQLSWRPIVSFEDLITSMVKADLALLGAP